MTRWPALVDPQRVSIAADLYNRVHADLVEAGWEEVPADDVVATPGWWWRHSDHPGKWAMDAAMIVVCQAKPKRDRRDPTTNS